MATKKCTPAIAVPASELQRALRARAEAKRLLDQAAALLASRPSMHDVDAAIRFLARGVVGLRGEETSQAAVALLQYVASGELEVCGVSDGQLVFVSTGIDRSKVTESA